MIPRLVGAHNCKGKNRSFNWALFAIVFALMVSYAAAFPFLIQPIGPAYRLLGAIFILPACIVWGVRGGLTTGAVTFLLNLLLHYYTGSKFEGGFIGPLTMVAAVFVIGKLSDLRRQLNTRLEERNQAEEKLRRSEEKYRHLFEMESDSLALIDAETWRILDVNSAAVALFGYQREEILQMTAVTFSAEPDKTFLFIKERREKVPVQYLRKKDGTVFPTEITLRQIELQGRQVFIIAIRDISDRIEAEKEKREIERQLQRAHRMEAIGTLAGGIAHDFNNILGAILGYAELLQMQKNKEGLKWKSHLDQIRKSAFRAKDLVQQILTFSRKNYVSARPIMAAPIVKEVLQLMRATIPANVKISSNITMENDTIIADPIQIHQVIMNLCTNASQAMAGKGGELEISLSNVYLDSNFANGHPDIRPGHHLEISIKDTGHGISPKNMEKVFNPYFTTKEKGQGTGLGLSVVHGIVQRQQGCITVESSVGKGANFKVYLPNVQLNAETDEKSLLPIQKGAERILVVDDEPTLTDMMAEMLQEMEYHVESRTSSVEALALFKAKPDAFDLVITDMTMPNITGTELSVEITRIKPDIPIIICTGFSENIDDAKAKMLGFKKLIMKPVTAQDLSQAVREALDNSRQRVHS